MKIYQTKKIERRKIKYVICNSCGKNIDIDRYKDFLNIVKVWGYNSNYDNEVHEIEICEDCYKVFVSKLKIKPSVKRKRKFICL